MTTQIRVTYFCPNCSEHCFLSKTVNYPDFFGSGGRRSSSASVRPSPSAPFRFLAFLRVCSSLLPLSSGLSGVRCIGFLFFSIISFELLSLRQVSRVSERQEAVATRPEGSCNAAERSSEGSNCAGSKSLACLSKKNRKQIIGYRIHAKIPPPYGRRILEGGGNYWGGEIFAWAV